MDEIVQRKSEIEEKLKQDEENLARFKESLQKSNDLTKNMVGILDSFTDRLTSLGQTIQPVHHQTISLTNLQDNITKLQSGLDRVIGYYHIGDEVEAKIKKGPLGNVELYLQLMDQLRIAMEFFNQSKPGSVELSTVTTLFDDGLEQLNRGFRQLLKQHSRHVPEAILIDIANALSDEEIPPLEHLPYRVVQELVAISKYLAGPGQSTDYMSVYHQLRSTQLGRSLAVLREYTMFQFTSSVLPKQQRSITNFLKGESPAKRVAKRKGDGRREPGGSVRRVLLEQSVTTATTVGKFDSDEQLEGTSVFMALATVCVRLLESEHTLMEAIIPTNHWIKVFESLVTGPFNFFIKVGEDLHDRAKKSLSKHDFIVIVPMCRVIRQLRHLEPSYSRLIKNLPNRCYYRLPEIITLLEKQVLKGVNDLTSFIKSDPDKQSNMPKDGTVHQLTSNTMLFLEQLLEQADVIGSLLAEQDIGLSNSSNTELANRRATGQYIIRVLDVLNMTMESKAKLCESPTLAAVFLMNNYYFIRSTFVRDHQMLAVLEEVHPDIDGRYNELIGSQRSQYTKRFNKLMSFVGQTSPVSASVMGSSLDKLGKSQREAIKDKFKGFNAELEDLQKIQRHYTIPDRDLRKLVRDSNKDSICPVYEEFYKNHLNVNFTKNLDKYIKYKPREVEVILDSFFDGQLQSV